MESLLDLDRRVVRFVERHWDSVRVAALAVLAGLAVGGIAAGALFGTSAALRAGVLTVLSGAAVVGTCVLVAALLLPEGPERPAGR